MTKTCEEEKKDVFFPFLKSRKISRQDRWNKFKQTNPALKRVK